MCAWRVSGKQCTQEQDKCHRQKPEAIFLKPMSPTAESNAMATDLENRKVDGSFVASIGMDGASVTEVAKLKKLEDAGGSDPKASRELEAMGGEQSPEGALQGRHPLDELDVGGQGVVGRGVDGVVNEDIETELVLGCQTEGREHKGSPKSDDNQVAVEWSHGARRKRRAQLGDSDDEGGDVNGAKELENGQVDVSSDDGGGDSVRRKKLEKGDVDEMDEEDELASFIRLRMEDNQGQQGSVSQCNELFVKLKSFGG